MLVEPRCIVRGRNYVTGGVAHAPGAGVGGQRSLWMAKRRRLRESGGPDGRSERPAMGRGQPRPTKRRAPSAPVPSVPAWPHGH